jgi:hypothetical protein
MILLLWRSMSTAAVDNVVSEVPSLLVRTLFQ